MEKNWNKNYNYKKRPNEKWVQKDGSNCEDIVFTNGEIEVDFDTWLKINYS